MGARVEEHQGRPEILEALNSMVNSSEHFLAKAKNDTENKAPEDAYFTTIELEALEKKINETKTWIEEKMKIIEAQPMHEFPTVNNKLIAVHSLDSNKLVVYCREFVHRLGFNNFHFFFYPCFSFINLFFKCFQFDGSEVRILWRFVFCIVFRF